MKIVFEKLHAVIFIFLTLGSCEIKNNKPSAEEINSIDLRRGELVACGPQERKFGTVAFEISCTATTKNDFNLGVALLHSFEYEEAEKVFAKIIDEEPGCAMAYWGVAMCNYHPLWSAPSGPELVRGSKAIAFGQSIHAGSEREADYLNAIAIFYHDWDKVDHLTRSKNYEKAMEKIYLKYPRDKEAAIFYALSLDAAANPGDKSYTNQKKAGSILNTIYPDEPDHPGIVHYIIHTYDYPGLAELALPAARKYASIAPASAHAQHMPSHIFTRLGLWDDCIKSNLVSTASAKCYAENAGMKGHWGEELHAMDYLVYAYLQKADDSLAKQQWDYLKTIQAAYPVDFKVAYAFAAIPARYLLEKKMWREAAALEIHPVDFPWGKFPWQEAIFHFAKIMGLLHTNNLTDAGIELTKLNILHDTLLGEKDLYKANQVQIQIKMAGAWMLYAQGENKLALELMNEAADMEDATEKHPVTPGEVIPARELLGDMYLQMGNSVKALEAYQKDMDTHPKRFNGLYGAGFAAEKTGDRARAKNFYQQLLDQCPNTDERTELVSVRSFIKEK